MGTPNLFKIQNSNNSDASYFYTFNDGFPEELTEEFNGIDKKFKKIIDEINARIQQIGNDCSLETIHLKEWKDSIVTFLSKPMSIEKLGTMLTFGSTGTYFPNNSHKYNTALSHTFTQNNSSASFTGHPEEDLHIIDQSSYGVKEISDKSIIIEVKNEGRTPHSSFVKMNSLDVQSFAQIFATLPNRYALTSNLMNIIGIKQIELMEEVNGDWSKVERCSLYSIESSLRFFTFFMFGAKRALKANLEKADEEILETIENFSPTRIWAGNFVNLLTLFHPEMFEPVTMAELNFIQDNSVEADIVVNMNSDHLETMELRFHRKHEVNIEALQKSLNQNIRKLITDAAKNWGCKPEYTETYRFKLQCVKTLDDDFQPISIVKGSGLSQSFLLNTWQTYRMKANLDLKNFHQAQHKVEA